MTWAAPLFVPDALALGLITPLGTSAPSCLRRDSRWTARLAGSINRAPAISVDPPALSTSNLIAAAAFEVSSSFLAATEVSSSFLTPAAVSFFRISLRWSWAVVRVAGYQHLAPSRPGALKVQDGHASGWFCCTAAAEGKHVRASLLGANGCPASSGNVCDGLASIPLSVGLMSKGAVGCNDAV